MFVLSFSSLVFQTGYLIGTTGQVNVTSEEDKFSFTIPTIDVGLPVTIVVLSSFMFIIFKISKKMQKFFLEYGLSRDRTNTGIPKSSLYHRINTKEEIIPVIVNLSNNLKTIITIYGILLSFIIATQLQLASSSFTFIIWVGVILSVIIRGWYFEHELSDIWVIKDLEETKSMTVSARLFSRRAAYLFVLVLSVTPAFYFVPHDQNNSLLNPWNNIVSVFSISIGIIVTTVITYQMIFGFGKRTSGGSQLVFISLSFLVFSLFGLNISPLEELSITFFGSFKMVLPLVMVVIIVPLYMLAVPYGMIFVSFPVGGYIYKKIKVFTNRKNKMK